MNARTPLLIVFLVIFLAPICYSQDLSNKGTDFWVVYPGHIDATASRLALYISASKNTTGTVSLAGTTIPFSVTANQATVVQVYPNTYNVYNSQSDGINPGKGIHIVSNDPIVVYAHVLNSARSGSTLVLPTNTLGREYTCIAYKQVSNGTTAKSQFTMVGVEDNTTVEITPTAASVNNTRAAGVTFTINLNKGDVYQYQSYSDITGSKIKTISNGTTGCKPLAVFSGSTWDYFDCTAGNSGDNLFQQLFPFASWGKSYITAPLAGRSYDIFRILVQDPATVVSLNGITLPSSSLINNTYYEFKSSNPNIISSDKPILVVQYMTTMACTPGSKEGDPEMIILNAEEQTLNNVTVLSARKDLTPPNTNISSHYLNIITKSSSVASLKIDGAAPASTMQTIPNSNYVYFQENVTNSTNSNPTHNITCDSGFTAVAYGTGNVESYGYNAGTNVKDLYQFITLKNQYATVDFPATCRNTPFYFSITLPYNPNSLTWDFNNNPEISPNNQVVNTAPAADSFYQKDGRTLYVYRLPSQYTFNKTGTYSIKVTANNPTPDGCSGIQEITYDVVVFDPPVTDFSYTFNGCLSDTAHFTDLSSSSQRPVNRWIWSFGDLTFDYNKNPSKKYNRPGTFPVRLQAITDIGCLSDTTKTIFMTSDPVVKFGIADTTCLSTPITFTDSSSLADGNLVKWTWNFGDSSAAIINSTGSPVTHTYSPIGAYAASLQVETNSGCKSTVFTKNVDIHPYPAVNFILPEVCLNDAFAQFTDSTFIADGSESGFKYTWDFGDVNATTGNPNTANTKNPKHKYSATGQYDIKLTVDSKDGCTTAASKTFTVNGSYPVADFNVLNSGNLCSNEKVEIQNISTVTPGAITKLEIFWDVAGNPSNIFVDDNPVFQKIYTNYYPITSATRTYEVKLKAYSGTSCVSEITKSITVNGKPTLVFTQVPGICLDASPRQVTQAKEVDGVAGSGLYYGPGISASGLFTPSITDTGTFLLKYMYTSNMGCKDSITNTITVWPSPVAKWTYGSPTCEMNNITFTDSSVANFSNIVEWNWNFNDGTTAKRANNQTFTKTFSAYGNYNVALQVKTDSGCISKPFPQSIAVHPLPAVNFSLPVVCVPGPASQFFDSTIIADNTQAGFKYYWTFGDPADTSSSAAKNPMHTYTASQPYTVSLTVTSINGCSNTTTKQLTSVFTSPTAKFGVSPGSGCLGANFAFTDSSVAGSAGINAWKWNMGDGSSSTTQNTSRTYTSANTFSVDLVVSDGNGCNSPTLRKDVIVYPYPVVNAGPDIMVLEGGSSVLNPTASGNGLTFAWSPTSFLDNPTILHPTTSPLTDITYTISVTGDGGCKSSDDVFVKILKTPGIPNAFSPNGDGINDVWDIQYLESYPGATIDVYNRYGQVVFTSVGYKIRWDGSLNGKPLPVGVYYYVINPKNGRQPMTGSVSILR